MAVYIDPDYSGTEAGTEAQPWNSWGDVTWTLGETYLQKRNTVAQIAAPLTPTADDITIGAYGVGSRPVLEINTASQTSVVTFSDITGYTFQDFEVRWDGVNALSTSAIRNVQTSATDVYALIDNVWVSGVNMDNSAIKGITGTNSNHITIQNCEIENVGTDAIFMSVCHYINIFNCYIHDFDGDSNSGGDGIQLNTDAHHWHIAGNTILFNKLTGNKGCIVGSGYSLGYDNGHCIIEDNYIKGGNWSVSVGGHYAIIRNNYMEVDDTLGDYNVQVGFGSKIYNNIMVGGDSTESILFADNSDYPEAPTEIYNNTIIMSGGTNSRGMDIGGGVTIDNGLKVILRNNIFYLTQRINANGRFYALAADTELISSNNLFFGITGTPKWQLPHPAEDFTRDTLTQVQSEGYEQDSLYEDPLLNADYTLSDLSPCIGAGVKPLDSRDYTGRYLKGNSYNIGAFWSDTIKDSTVAKSLLASGVTK